jgi:hypothetical protein
LLPPAHDRLDLDPFPGIERDKLAVYEYGARN